MTTTLPPAPSGASLLKATLLALVVAGIVLVTMVLPAEYGIDPLGTGRALGLDDLYAAKAEVEAQAAAPAAPPRAARCRRASSTTARTCAR
jgi:hypothetical protein